MAQTKKTSTDSPNEIKTSASNEKFSSSLSAGCCGENSDTSSKNDLKTTKKPIQSSISMTSTSSNKSGCCMGTTSCETSKDHSMQNLHSQKSESKKGPKTRIVVRYDVGIDNSLTLRGKGANLSWDKGTPLKNVKQDEWIWETENSFTTCEFKVLINDNHYEMGENHPISCGASIQYTPKF